MERILLLLLLLVMTPGDTAADPMKRPMEIVRESTTGLEVWVEANPLWTWEVRRVRGQPVLVVESPSAYYPPATFFYVRSRKLDPGEGQENLKTFALGAIHTAASQFGLQKEAISEEHLKPVSYNLLNGYEVDFPGVTQGQNVESRMFVGKGEEGGPVLMQVITLQGKLAHLEEQIRRAWTNVAYHPH